MNLEERKLKKRSLSLLLCVCLILSCTVAALAADDLFVMEADGVICATARINQVQVPEYRNADWRYADVPENEIMVLHTLVVDPGTAGHGCGKAFVSFYEQYAIDHG